MPAWAYDSGPWGLVIFLFTTVGLGGLAALATGRALALTWRPAGLVPAAMLPLAAAVRFIHYAIFGETLLSARSFALDYLVLLALAATGYAVMRGAQMAGQYPWLSNADQR